MPFIRSLVSKCYTLLVTSISLNREIINPYSYYMKKGLVYIVFISPFRRQPFFYLECTKVNTYSSYNIYSVSFNKCIFLTIYLVILQSL
jgi:hypothetical protein